MPIWVERSQEVSDKEVLEFVNENYVDDEAKQSFTVIYEQWESQCWGWEVVQWASMEVFEMERDLWKRRPRSDLVGRNAVSWTNQPRSKPACDRHHQKETRVSVSLFPSPLNQFSPKVVWCIPCKGLPAPVALLQVHGIQAGGRLSLCWSTADREGELDSKSRSDDHVFRDFDLVIRSQSFTISQHQSRILMMIAKMIMSRRKTRIDDDDDACSGNFKNCNIDFHSIGDS